LHACGLFFTYTTETFVANLPAQPEQVKKEEAEKGTKLSKSGLERHEKNSTNDPDTLRSMQSKFSARTYEGRDKIEDEVRKSEERRTGGAK